MARVVYSSELGSMCPSCGKPVGACACRAGDEPAAGDGVVRIRRETKGRRGKTVTVITGVPLAGGELAELARSLRKACGAGGTVSGTTIEIQGDHRDRVARELSARGLPVRPS